MAEIMLVVWALAVMGFDLWQRRLPNALTLSAAAIGLAVLLLGGETLLGLAPQQAWLALGLATLLTLPAYALRLLGAGDVKLAIAIALLTGLHDFIAVYGLAVFLALGLLLVVRFAPYLPYGHLLLPTGSFGQAGGSRRRVIPFGAALGAGLLLVLIGRLAGLSV